MLEDLIKHLSNVSKEVGNAKVQMSETLDQLKKDENYTQLANELDGAIQYAFKNNDLSKLNKVLKDVTNNK